MLAWIAAALAGGWQLPRRRQPYWLAGWTALFLARHDPFSLAAMAAITLLTGGAAITLRGRSAALLGAMAGCLGALLLYRGWGGSGDGLAQARLLGFAFYVLRAVHLLLECYSGRLPPPRWGELIAWFWFLPTLSVGPIHRFAPFLRDLNRRRWDPLLFDEGLRRLLFGYFKLAVLGNYLVGEKFAGWVGALDPGSWAFAYFDALRYGLSLYLRFAGYSDIAIGFALLLGFRVMENFHLPFLATDIVEFWRRWHISLSAWCRDYVYIPVLSLTRRPALAALASMVLLGVWHELSWRYLLWGLWHGAGIALCQRWQRSAAAARLNGRWGRFWAPVALLLTQHFVLLSFTLTGVDDLGETLARWRILLWIVS